MLSVILAAAVAATQPAPPSAGAPKDPDARVCHVEPIQGSRIPHKVCLRASEAAQLQRDAHDLLARAQAGSQAPNMAAIVSMGPLR